MVRSPAFSQEVVPVAHAEAHPLHEIVSVHVRGGSAIPGSGTVGGVRTHVGGLTDYPSRARPPSLAVADLGFGDLGYTGSSIKTPNIDALATSGVILGNYYVMHCCTPTRSALATGRYPIR